MLETYNVNKDHIAIDVFYESEMRLDAMDACEAITGIWEIIDGCWQFRNGLNRQLSFLESYDDGELCMPLECVRSYMTLYFEIGEEMEELVVMKDRMISYLEKLGISPKKWKISKNVIVSKIEEEVMVDGECEEDNVPN